MRYVLERCKKDMRDETYRIYVTDALKAIVGGNERYVDYVTPQKQEKRTSEEVVAHIKDKLNKFNALEVSEDG